MGAIKAIIDQFDQSDELANVQRELVETLSNLANDKAKLFMADIEQSLRTAGNGENKTIQVNAIVAKKIWVHAYTSKSADSIGTAVTDALSAFIEGTSDSIIKGVSTLISKALTTFLGEASASTGEIREYYLVTEGLSIVRIDICSWYLNVSSSSVYDKMQRVTAFVGVKSTVDLSKIDFNTFLYLYQKQLNAGGLSAEQLKDALTTAKAIYKDYTNMIGSVAAPVTVIAHPPAASHLS